MITLAPPAVRTPAGRWSSAGVISSSAIAGGLALRQAVGTAQIDAQLAFVHGGVLRYEVLYWGGLTPQETAVAGRPPRRRLLGRSPRNAPRRA